MCGFLNEKKKKERKRKAEYIVGARSFIQHKKCSFLKYSRILDSIIILFSTCVLMCCRKRMYQYVFVDYFVSVLFLKATQHFFCSCCLALIFFFLSRKSLFLELE